jgi:ferritin-like metal-binding protein YciE
MQSQASLILTVAFFAAVLSGCAFGGNGSKPDPAEVRSLRAEPSASERASRLTALQLREAVSRFAYRYAGLSNEVIDAIKREATSPEARLLAQDHKLALVNALVSIAGGLVPTINLLDMVVLVTLVRMTVEQHWVTAVPNEAQGKRWLEVAREGERDIWSIASQMLDTAQQAVLRQAIETWWQQHPQATFVYNVRFSDFVRELGPDAEQIAQPRGLLPEVSEATRSVDEVRRTAERALFFAQIAPSMARYEAEVAVYELAAQPELKQLMTSLGSFTATSDNLSAALDRLPTLVATERQAAIEQVMSGLAREGENLLLALDQQAVRLGGVLAQLKETLEVGAGLTSEINATFATVDSLVTRLELDRPTPEKKAFKIQDYQQAFSEATITVTETNNLLHSLDRFLSDRVDETKPGPFQELVETLDQTVAGWLVLAFILGALLVLFIAVVVLAMLIYRRRVLRMASANGQAGGP